jgi:hypothetical protein
MIRSYFIGQSYLGQSRVSAIVADSYAYYCQACGEVYARLPVDRSSKWVFRPGCCEKCQPVKNAFQTAPGSLWCGYDREFNKDLPREVLEREFRIYLKEWLEEEAEEDGLQEDATRG